VGPVTTRVALAAVVLAALLGASAGQTVALDLDPFEHYEFDYSITFSDEAVEPEQPFTITLSIDIRCIKDMPIGANEAVVVMDVTARPLGPGNEIALMDGFELRLDDVPDWQGESLSVEESAEMSFPSDTAFGQYEMAAAVSRVVIDGWNVTGLIPREYKTIPIGSISCEIDEPVPPEPQIEPGRFGVYILGHDFSVPVDEDGFLLEPLSTELIEGQVALSLEEGTRCMDGTLEPVGHASVVRNTSPEPFEGGLVLAAYSLQPTGARFSPAITLEMAYPEALPDEVSPGTLLLAEYNQVDEEWRPVDSVPDTTRGTLSTRAPRLGTYAIVAPTSETLPAILTERELLIDPAQTHPYGPVEVSAVVENSGGVPGMYHLAVTVDGRLEHSEDVEVEPGESRIVRAVVTRTLPGEYEVTVGSLTGSLVVVSASETDSGQNKVDAPGAATPAVTQSEPSPANSEANPAHVALLVLAVLAFLTLVVLVLVGVL